MKKVLSSCLSALICLLVGVILWNSISYYDSAYADEVVVENETIINEKGASNNIFTDEEICEIFSAEKSNKNAVESFLDIFEMREGSFHEYLLNEKKNYESLLNNEDEKDFACVAIQAVNKSLNAYEQYINYKSNINTKSAIDDLAEYILNAAVDTLLVEAAIKYLLLIDYKLSSVLLRAALGFSGKPYENTLCNPQYYGRVVNSDIVYDIARSGVLSGSSSFNKNVTTIDYDLLYSIHEFTYSKPYGVSREITIMDQYDYASNSHENFTGTVRTVIAKMYEAQQLRVITPYNLKITIDLSLFPHVTKIKDNSDIYTLRVHNFDYSPRYLYYNTKTCFEGNARNWTNLEDVREFYLPAGQEIEITISKNGLAETAAICYIKGKYRYSTFAFDLSGASNDISVESIRLEYLYQNNMIGIVGKNSTKWLIGVYNDSEEVLKVEYNKNMCFEGDAKNWTVKDVAVYYIYPQDYYIFSINENGFAETIAFRFSGASQGTIVYAYDLDTDGSMTIFKSNFEVINYLQIQNISSVSGGWSIEITNTAPITITVDYNKKMCFESDAKTWNLKDVVSFSLYPNGSKTVKIESNWFAGTVAASYVLNGKRYISYGYDLSSIGSILVKNCIITE